MEAKNDQHHQPTRGFYLTRQQLIRICALGLTSAICVGLSIRYSGDMMTLDFDIDKNRIFFKKLSIVSHIFSFSSWFGCSIWISFVGGFVMFNNLPRHVFGKLQSKMFPRYFQFSLIMMVLSSISWLIWTLTVSKHENGLKHSALLAELLDIITSNQTPVILHFSILACICTNLLYFEPQTTSTMFKRHVIEKKIGTGDEIGAIRPTDPKILEAYNEDGELRKINKRFGVLHGMSTIINLIAICLGFAHIFWLAEQL